MSTTGWHAAAYVLSGVGQPLLMTLLKATGLANAKAQLYMVFYYLGPTLLLPMAERAWPPQPMLVRAAGIALWDIGSTTLNYTGASLAGPTIFSILYASVTIWTALLSEVVFDRSLNGGQWCAIAIVCAGLALTCVQGLELGPQVGWGTMMVLLGSLMHAATYVFSEYVMCGPHGLTITQNSALQGVVACVCLMAWQLMYTLPRVQDLIFDPLQNANTSWPWAIVLLLTFTTVNLVHCFTFYHTLKHLSGGATSAGVLKGLQAVLVFVASHLLYCGRKLGGSELCFTMPKLWSLGSVVVGVSLFGWATPDDRNMQRYAPIVTGDGQSPRNTEMVI